MRADDGLGRRTSRSLTLFQPDDFAKAYHVFLNDIVHKKTASADPLVDNEAKRFQQDQQPTWASTSWPTSSTPVFDAKFTEVETITGLMSSGDDECAGDEGMGRAAKQALKKETPWRSINAQDRPHFCQGHIGRMDRMGQMGQPQAGLSETRLSRCQVSVEKPHLLQMETLRRRTLAQSKGKNCGARILGPARTIAEP